MFKKISPATAAARPQSDLPASSHTASRPTSTPPSAARGLSILSSDVQLDGLVSGSGDLQIDGQIRGDVRIGRLIVGETGAIDGNVWADYLEVSGRIVGAISAHQVRLTSTGYVNGDITAEQLSIDAGAYFQGRVLKSPPTPAASPEATPT